MAKDSRNSPAIRAYVRRSENPYASIGVMDDPDVHSESVFSEQERAYGRELQNQYVWLSLRNNGDPSPITAATVKRKKATEESLSKVEFRARCRQIFKYYIPALEQGRLRSHHRDFITRNESRSGTARHRLLQQLEKYNLSNVPGLNAHFNRERDSLTEAKLRMVEQSIKDDD